MTQVNSDLTTLSGNVTALNGGVKWKLYSSIEQIGLLQTNATLDNILAGLSNYAILEFPAWYTSYTKFTFASTSTRHIIKVVSSTSGYAYAMDFDLMVGKTYTNFYNGSVWSGWK